MGVDDTHQRLLQQHQTALHHQLLPHQRHAPLQALTQTPPLPPPAYRTRDQRHRDHSARGCLEGRRCPLPQPQLLLLPLLLGPD